MKQRLAVWIAFVALALRVVAPLAAYAAPPAFLGEICSTRTAAPAAGATGTPQAPLDAPQDAHLASHCADCPFGATALALPAAIVPDLLAAASNVERPAAGPTVRATTAILLPPPRGPPSILDSA